MTRESAESAVARGPYQQVIDLVVRAMRACDFAVKEIDAPGGTISASAGVSFKSWGENIRAVLRSTPDQAIVITLESSLKLGIAPWGKNKENVHHFFDILVSLSNTRSP